MWSPLPPPRAWAASCEEAELILSLCALAERLVAQAAMTPEAGLLDAPAHFVLVDQAHHEDGHLRLVSGAEPGTFWIHLAGPGFRVAGVLDVDERGARRRFRIASFVGHEGRAITYARTPLPSSVH